MDSTRPSRAYLPRSSQANAIDWELPGGGAVASSSRQNRQSLTSPLARLSTIMASVRSSLVGQSPGDEEIGTARTHVYYSGDKTTGSSSDDDTQKGKAGKLGVREHTNSLRAVSSLESLSVVQQRREEERAGRLSTQPEDDEDDSRLGRLSAALQRRRRTVLMAVGALIALILVVGLGAGLGVRAARSRALLLANSGSAMSPTSTSAIVPVHPTATPVPFNVTSSANTTQTSTSSPVLPSSTISSNSSTVLPPTSSTTPLTTVPPSSTPIPTPSDTPAPSTPPPPAPTTSILTTPVPSPDPTPAPAPAPTPEPAPSPAPVPVPAPAPPNTPSGSPDGGPFSGDVTFYAPGLGACGRYNAATDYIAAVSESLFDSVGAAHGIYNPNANPLCGRRIRVTLDSSVGATVDVTIVDRCTACAQNDVDLSPSAFGQLAGASLGRVRGSWFFLD